MNDFVDRWQRDAQAWDPSNPPGASQPVDTPNDTPAGWVCFRHTATGDLVAVVPGTRTLEALTALTLADGRRAWAQVFLPTRAGLMADLTTDPVLYARQVHGIEFWPNQSEAVLSTAFITVVAAARRTGKTR